MEHARRESNDVTKFVQTRIKNFDKEIECLTASKAKFTDDIEELSLRKSQALETILAAEFDNNVAYVQDAKQFSETCLVKVVNAIELVNQNSETSSNSLGKLVPTFHKQGQQSIAVNEFTMMPYFDVESEITKLTEATAEVMKEINDNKPEDTNTLRDENCQLLWDINSLKHTLY